MKILARHTKLTSIVFVALLTLSGCSELGKKYISVNVKSDPPGASVDALIDNKISGGVFSPTSFGSTPTGRKTMYFGFGNPGVGDTKLGVRVKKAGYKVYEVFYTREECYSSVEEAHKNVKDIFVKLEPLDK